MLSQPGKCENVFAFPWHSEGECKVYFIADNKVYYVWANLSTIFEHQMLVRRRQYTLPIRPERIDITPNLLGIAASQQPAIGVLNHFIDKNFYRKIEDEDKTELYLIAKRETYEQHFSDLYCG